MNNNFDTPTACHSLPLLLDATLDELRTGLDARHFTSLQLVQAYIRRIQRSNPELEAISQINPDAVITAIQRDNERDMMRNRSQLSSLGPLHGIPILVKHTIATDDKMSTAASFYGLRARVPEDSTVIAKLRDAKAIIIGKSNTQWSLLREDGYYDNLGKWIRHGKKTKGAYFHGQVPKGSSGGCAVATALGFAWASLVTDIDGSIAMPASQSNVVGFKPTVGLTSRHLAFPPALGQEHADTMRLESVGTMTRTVKDAAYLLKAVMGLDRKDAFTTRIPFDLYPNYVAACREDGLQGMRIGFLRSLAWFFQIRTYDLSKEKFNEALDVMRKAQATVVDGIVLNGAVNTDRDGSHPRRCALDFSLDFPKQLEHDDKTTSQELPEHEQGYFDELGLLAAFEQFELDAIVTWPHIAATLCSRMGNICAITVPLAKLGSERPVIPGNDGSIDSTPNKPYGISFISTSFQEEKLFKIAYAFEQLTQARTKIHPIIVPKGEVANFVLDPRFHQRE